MRRDEVETLLRSAYAARAGGDLDATLRHFAEGAAFAMVGSPAASPVPLAVTGQAAIREVLTRLVEGFAFRELDLIDLVVEGDRAAARWQIRVVGPDGSEAVTQMADFVRFEDGRIASMTQFVDTALAGQMLGR